MHQRAASSLVLQRWRLVTWLSDPCSPHSIRPSLPLCSARSWDSRTLQSRSDEEVDPRTSFFNPEVLGSIATRVGHRAHGERSRAQATMTLMTGFSSASDGAIPTSSKSNARRIIVFLALFRSRDQLARRLLPIHADLPRLGSPLRAPDRSSYRLAGSRACRTAGMYLAGALIDFGFRRNLGAGFGAWWCPNDDSRLRRPRGVSAIRSRPARGPGRIPRTGYPWATRPDRVVAGGRTA